ncbi:MAG: hypothetical protein ACOC0H_02565 [Thermodesulfobacteriota bacterium]
MLLMDYDNGEQGRNHGRIMTIKKIRRITAQEFSFPPMRIMGVRWDYSASSDP